MATSGPAALTSLTPGANIGGSSVAIPPLPGSIGTGAIGGLNNPFMPATVSGQSSPPLNAVFPANSTSPGAPAPGNAGIPGGLGSNVSSGSAGGNALFRGLMGQGIPAGIAGLIQQFLAGGAGYNPQVAADLIAQLQPSIERGTENIVEQFSATGNRFGSPAAVGLGDYMSQVNLNIGEILSNLYEQSVQNYMSVMMGIAKPKQQSGGVLGTLGALLGPISGAAGAASAAGVGGTAGSILDVIAGLA